MNEDTERAEYVEAMRDLQRMHDDSLLKHGAVDMFAGRDYVAYVIPEPNDRVSAELWRWGVNHDKVAFADSVEDLYELVSAVYK
jgi:hypothetical protein